MTFSDIVGTVLLASFVGSIALAAIQLRAYNSIKKIDEGADIDD